MKFFNMTVYQCRRRGARRLTKRMLPNLPLVIFLRNAPSRDLWHGSHLLKVAPWASSSWCVGQARGAEVQLKWLCRRVFRGLRHRSCPDRRRRRWERHRQTQTFDSWQVDAGMLVNPDAVADDPKRALLECTWACHQLRAAKKHRTHQRCD